MAPSFEREACSKTDRSCSKPEGSCPKPASPCSKPEGSCSAPAISCAMHFFINSVFGSWSSINRAISPEALNVYKRLCSLARGLPAPSLAPPCSFFVILSAITLHYIFKYDYANKYDYAKIAKDLDKRITFFKKIFTLTFRLYYHKMQTGVVSYYFPTQKL